jgi:hypothetical protein
MKNWPDQLKLFAVLSSVKVLLETISVDEGRGFESSKESLTIINDAISFFLEPKNNILPEDISMQFAPTGPLQEISLSNGWSEIYLKLAEQYDKYSYCFDKKVTL